MNEAHRDVMRWNFDNAWINKIEGPVCTPPTTKSPSKTWSCATKD
jgi:hypothetical protein